MPGPIVYVDHSDIVEGRLEDLRAALDGLVAHIAANQPRLLSYDVYLNADRTRSTVIHVHRDSASLEYHLDVIAPRLEPFRDLVRLRKIEVFGEPSDAVVQRLREKAARLGDATVSVHPHLVGVATAPVSGAA